MKFSLILFVCFVVFCACSNPDKVKTDGLDSAATTDPGDSIKTEPVLTDTLTIDSLKADVGFNPSDSQTFYLLANYVADSTVNPPFTDVQVIDSTCAVIIYPTDDQLKTLQTENADNFMAIADTYSYYQGSAIEMLDSIDIGTINAEKRYLSFKGRKFKGKKRKLWQLDVRKDGAPAWNLIFFNVNKEPAIISVTDLSRNRIMEYFDRAE